MPDNFDELMALHDGELPSDGAKAANSRLGEDPDSRELLDRLTAADKAFADAADELLELPVPQGLVDAVREPKAQKQPIAARVIPFPRRRGVVGLAIAAGIAAVVATNTQLFEAPSGPAMDGDAIAFGALLQDTLESIPSGDIADSEDGSIRITPVLTFRTASAEYCREFMAMQDGTEISGVACRSDQGQWRLSGQRQTPVGSVSDGYEAAGGEETITHLPSTLVKAQELDYAAEQDAIRSNWGDSPR